MRKFLSLALALVMAMSLVTISAGAVDYDELTDKDQITYEEGVAVLNKLGIITGYSDDSFRPDEALTRGAAAKIIASIMVGSATADALTADEAPFSDVPVDNVFAQYIYYCKTAGYISGYSDGTFKPTETLTGNAFAKMLLGALGYSSSIEKFTGTGWNLRVVSIAQTAGLFNDIAEEDYQLNGTITRQIACMYALNALKATEVKYDSTGVRSYVTSNNANINTNIMGADGYGQGNYYTLQLGEDKFPLLYLYEDKQDDFGRPAHQWIYNKTEIGTYAELADYVYTEQMVRLTDNPSDATKEKALGLRNCQLEFASEKVKDKDGNYISVANEFYINGVQQTSGTTGLTSVAEIANYTDYGTRVEVYMKQGAPSTIQSVVVIKSQLMQIDTKSSDSVTLKTISSPNTAGYNQKPINVKVDKVYSDETPYSVLSGLSANSYVVVIPVSDSSDATYSVAEAYVPDEVTGKISAVSSYSGTRRYKVTVGGEDYLLSLWNKEFQDLDAATIRATKNDVTLLNDEYGYPMYIKDAGSSSGYMVLASEYQQKYSDSSSVVVNILKGYDVLTGEEVEVNIGTQYSTNNTTLNLVNCIWGDTAKYGDLIRYTTENASGYADYVATGDYWYEDGTNTEGIRPVVANAVSSSDSKIQLKEEDGSTNAYYLASDVKYVYLTFDSNRNPTGYDTGAEVVSVSITSGRRNLSATDLEHAQAYVKESNGVPQVKAVVVVKGTPTLSMSSILYIKQDSTNGGSITNTDGKALYSYEATLFDGSETTIYTETKASNLGAFYSYSNVYTDVDGNKVYTLNIVNQQNDAISSLQGYVKSMVSGSYQWTVLNDLHQAIATQSSSTALAAAADGSARIVADTADSNGDTYGTKYWHIFSSGTTYWEGMDLGGAKFFNDTDVEEIESLSDLYDKVIKSSGGYSDAWLKVVLNDKTSDSDCGVAEYVVLYSIKDENGKIHGANVSHSPDNYVPTVALVGKDATANADNFVMTFNGYAENVSFNAKANAQVALRVVDNGTTNVVLKDGYPYEVNYTVTYANGTTETFTTSVTASGKTLSTTLKALPYTSGGTYATTITVTSIDEPETFQVFESIDGAQYSIGRWNGDYTSYLAAVQPGDTVYVRGTTDNPYLYLTNAGLNLIDVSTWKVYNAKTQTYQFTMPENDIMPNAFTVSPTANVYFVVNLVAADGTTTEVATHLDNSQGDTVTYDIPEAYQDADKYTVETSDGTYSAGTVTVERDESGIKTVTVTITEKTGEEPVTPTEPATFDANIKVSAAVQNSSAGGWNVTSDQNVANVTAGSATDGVVTVELTASNLSAALNGYYEVAYTVDTDADGVADGPYTATARGVGTTLTFDIVTEADWTSCDVTITAVDVSGVEVQYATVYSPTVESLQPDTIGEAFPTTPVWTTALKNCSAVSVDYYVVTGVEGLTGTDAEGNETINQLTADEIKSGVAVKAGEVVSGTDYYAVIVTLEADDGYVFGDTTKDTEYTYGYEVEDAKTAYLTYTFEDQAQEKELEITGVTTATVKSFLNADGLKSAADGIYVITDAENGFVEDLAGTGEQNIFVKFTVPETTANNAGAVSLTIKNADGDVVYVESTSAASSINNAGGHFFYVQVLGDITGNAGAGIEEALSAGTYQCIVSKGDATLLDATFSIG